MHNTHIDVYVQILMDRRTDDDREHWILKKQCALNSTECISYNVHTIRQEEGTISVAKTGGVPGNQYSLTKTAYGIHVVRKYDCKYMFAYVLVCVRVCLRLCVVCAYGI
jgi:hypothetical protein